jgi:hypothetical protein
MTGRRGTLIIVLFLLTATWSVHAQQTTAPPPFPPRSVPQSTTDETAPAIYYRLDFAIRELNGEKLVDTRNYSLWAQSGVSESMAAGSEVPYPGSVFTTAGSGQSKSINYRSVGVTIHCSVKEGTDGHKLDLNMEISDVIPPEKDSDGIAFRRVSINSRALLSLGKPTTVSITEDPASRHRFQVDVTATKLK